jgi:hypothetical protein
MMAPLQIDIDGNRAGLFALKARQQYLNAVLNA